jgi:hypothetical protein
MTAADPSMAGRYDMRVNTLVGGLADDVRRDGNQTATSEEGEWRLEQTARALPPEPATLLRTIATDNEYRAQRLAELLQRAAQATRGGM